MLGEFVLGKNSVIRGAKVRIVKNGNTLHVIRPLSKLFPFETNDSGDSRQVASDPITSLPVTSDPVKSIVPAVQITSVTIPFFVQYTTQWSFAYTGIIDQIQ